MQHDPPRRLGDAGTRIVSVPSNRARAEVDDERQVVMLG